MVPNSYTAKLPSAIYVWIVPSEEVLDQPGSWRIRKWDTEPFPEANFTLPCGPSDAAVREILRHNDGCNVACGKTTHLDYVKTSRKCDSRRDCPDCPRDWLIEWPLPTATKDESK
jgi:hypothetical protein